ncbi:MAG: acyl transferase [Flavobacteriia bacterium]|nr:acyl transferase [Flavobacteriia bacterium]
MNNLENEIFSIQSKADFEEVVKNVFEFQLKNCKVYSNYCEKLGKTSPKTIFEIPFLPISFFKTHEIISSDRAVQFEFKSSGTTGMIRSRHLVQNPAMYERSFEAIYKDFIGNPEEQVILALLPNYIKQGNSSLIYMVEKLVRLSGNNLSGFYLDDCEKLVSNYKRAIAEGKKVILFGVSYALLDLAENKIDLSKALIIETGGMKGRRKELTKEELHQELIKGLNTDFIASEYGMTELFSQSYSDKNGIFKMPKWMQIFIREVNDPFHFLEEGKTGGINVIDLANLYSCSFIETQDLGKKQGDTFQLMGRFDHSDLRGCNMMVE